MFNIMRLLLFILLLLPITSTAQSAQDKILGTWLNEDKDGHIKIYKKGNKYYGKITWLKNPNDDNGKPVTDKENPDKSLRNRSIVGLVILKDLMYKDGEWVDGTVYDPNDGKTYTCALWFDNGNLRIRGYWGWFFATETWTRVR